MPKKPNAADYTPEAAALVRATTLYLATKLGDLLDDIVIVGGLVPSLLVPQDDPHVTTTRHVGTLDVDLGFALAILDEQRYHEICERLRSAGFSPDVSEAGTPTSQRWIVKDDGNTVTVDFLIPQSSPDDKAGRLRNLETGFAAIITPGLELAFKDRVKVTIRGETLRGERAERAVWVCGPGAFVVLKALALRNRGENKDAYDLAYLLQNYGKGVSEIADHLKPLLDSEIASEALAFLRDDFRDVRSIGPMRVAEFLGSPNDADISADAAGVVRALLEECAK